MGSGPAFLVHDNDGIFGQHRTCLAVGTNGRRHSYRCHMDRRLDEVMGIEGSRIPYGAANASPHVERFIRTLRYEALDHLIFPGAYHVRRVVTEYIRSYSPRPPRATRLPGAFSPVVLKKSQRTKSTRTARDSLAILPRTRKK
jgi:hypothetical protein